MGNNTTKEAEQLRWFQCVDLGDGYVTNGLVDHCTEPISNSRYGIPIDLKGKTVLDIGAMNGYHSLLAERRGAVVTSIEPTQGGGDNWKCLQLALSANKSNIKAIPVDLYSFHSKPNEQFDICFYFGVLYHVEDPIKELIMLRNLTKEFALIETAIAQGNYGNNPVWEMNHGFDNDDTNIWYPSLAGLTAALKYAGFSQVELIWTDGIRSTVKALV